MEVSKENTKTKLDTNIDVNNIARNRQYLLSLSQNKEFSWEDQIVRFLQEAIVKNTHLAEEYRNFDMYKDYPLQNLSYFLLEKYGIYLQIEKESADGKRLSMTLSPVVSKISTSPNDYDIQKRFPIEKDFQSRSTVYVINDEKLSYFTWYTKSFYEKTVVRSQIVVVNLFPIRQNEEIFYKKIYWTANADLWMDGAIAHELTHYAYTTVNNQKIKSVDWNDIGAKNPYSIVEFLAEYSEFMCDDRVISKWLVGLMNKMRIWKNGDLEAWIGWQYDFIHNKLYEVLNEIFKQKWLSLKEIILSGFRGRNKDDLTTKIDIIRSIVRLITPKDVETVRKEFTKLQKYMVGKIEHTHCALNMCATLSW